MVHMSEKKVTRIIAYDEPESVWPSWPVSLFLVCAGGAATTAGFILAIGGKEFFGEMVKELLFNIFG